MKDRIHEFKTYRDSYAYFEDNDGDEVSIGFPFDEENFDDDLLDVSEVDFSALDDYLNQIENIQSCIGLLQSYVEDVRLKHASILTTPQNDPRTSEEVENLRTAIKQLSTQIQEMLNSLHYNSQTGEKSSLSDVTIRRIKEAQKSSVFIKFQRVMQEYTEEQHNYKQRCLSRINSYLEVTGRQLTTDELDDMIESGNLQKYASGILIERRKNQIILDELESRQRELFKLEESIRDIKALFTELAFYVEQQGGLIDRIEYHVELTNEYLERSQKKIIRAQKLQNRYRKKRLLCIFVGVGSLIMLIIIITITLCQTGLSCGTQTVAAKAGQSEVIPS